MNRSENPHPAKTTRACVGGVGGDRRSSRHSRDDIPFFGSDAARMQCRSRRSCGRFCPCDGTSSERPDACRPLPVSARQGESLGPRGRKMSSRGKTTVTVGWPGRVSTYGLSARGRVESRAHRQPRYEPADWETSSGRRLAVANSPRADSHPTWRPRAE